MSDYSFIAELDRRMASAPPRVKGERTRFRFKIAGAKALEELGFHDMRVLDVARLADASEGLFYTYFPDKKALTRDILLSFLDFIRDHIMRRAGGDTFQAIQTMNRRYIALHRQNSGLFRCLYQFVDNEPSFGARMGELNMSYVERLALGLGRRRGDTEINPALVLVANMLSGLMDDLVRKLVVYPDPALAKLIETTGANDTDIADAAAILWFRLLYANQELPAGLSPLAWSVAEGIGMKIPQTKVAI
jgi:AcrR family transcriptional regulator